MKIFILSIQIFFFSLFLNSCGSGDSNESDKADESPRIIIVKELHNDFKRKEFYEIQFENGNIQELTEKTYNDGSISTLFTVNDEIIFEKKYESPTTYPQELLKFKKIIEYKESFVRDDETFKEFKNKYKISDIKSSIESYRSDHDFSPEEKERLQRELKEKLKAYREQKFKENQQK